MVSVAGSAPRRRIAFSHIWSAGVLKHEIGVDIAHQPRRFSEFVFELARRPARVADDEPALAGGSGSSSRRRRLGDVERYTPVGNLGGTGHLRVLRPAADQNPAPLGSTGPPTQMSSSRLVDTGGSRCTITVPVVTSGRFSTSPNAPSLTLCLQSSIPRARSSDRAVAASRAAAREQVNSRPEPPGNEPKIVDEPLVSRRRLSWSGALKNDEGCTVASTMRRQGDSMNVPRWRSP